MLLPQLVNVLERGLLMMSRPKAAQGLAYSAPGLQRSQSFTLAGLILVTLAVFSNS
jgi:hypothetical protein